MSGVFHFARYSQRENFATNNTLLLMYRLYETSRRRYQEFLANLLDEKADAPIAALGLQLRQQEPSEKSVLDGYLYQAAVRIGIEAKAPGAAFDSVQLLNHLDRFDDGGSGYLLLLRPDKVDLTHKEWRDVHTKAAKKGVIVTSITFQQIVDCFRDCLRPHDDQLNELIDDFEGFCSEENLLGSTDWTIFVPPCGQSFKINEKNSLYFCPSEWSRRSARYLGIYRNKSVQFIGEIAKITSCEKVGGKLVAHDHSGTAMELSNSERSRISSAIEEADESNGWDLSSGHKFFLCDKLEKTDYRKTSPGGIMGHRYLDIRKYVTARRPPSLHDLAAMLNEQTWE
jgi:hypothetical protein